MKRAMIKPDQCQNCAACNIQINCEKKAVIREAPDDKPWIDFYHCAGCMKCKLYCRNDAVEEVTQPCSGKGRMGW